MLIEVTYMSGAGNLFSVIDNRKYNFSESAYSRIASDLCKPNKKEIGRMEGLLVINESKDYDFEVWFFNPDGSSSMMCGNGGRCAVRFGKDHGLFEYTKNNTISFYMAKRNYTASIIENMIRLNFQAPQEIKKKISLEIENKTIIGDYINNGSDHFVLDFNENFSSNINDFNNFDIALFAPSIRHHIEFKRKGTNVNVFFQESKNKLYLRTFERGVEAETGACGTGALATAISLFTNNRIDLPVTIIPSSKIPLNVYIGSSDNKIDSLVLEGPAEYIGKDFVEISV
jgi:diaminopimelate epimerase